MSTSHSLTRRFRLWSKLNNVFCQPNKKENPQRDQLCGFRGVSSVSDELKEQVLDVSSINHLTELVSAKFAASLD